MQASVGSEDFVFFGDFKETGSRREARTLLEGHRGWE